MESKKKHNVITIECKGVVYPTVSDFVRAFRGYNRSGVHSAITAAYEGEDEFFATYKKNTFKVKITHTGGRMKMMAMLKAKVDFLERKINGNHSKNEGESAANGK